ncbi:MAG TPA: S1 RNA-binding domain-containing protein [Tepidisphaeraceae bacterium]|nr:S1 RNA-binding domain-containing protein [Tepidisphaeraceae bacterium]
MSDTPSTDHKEKFHKANDEGIEAQLDQALAGVDVENLLDSNAPQPLAGKLRGLQSGSVQQIDIQKDIVLVELSGKAQGMARFSQFLTEPKMFDVVEVVVERFDPREGLYQLTPKGAASNSTDWDSLQVGSVVEGVVNGMNKGGLEIKIGQIRGFMPAGQIDLEFHKDISVFLAQKLLVEVTQIERDSKKLVVSRRKVLERERGELKAKLSLEIEEGQTRTGKVRSVTDFGAFVDLGGMDGLIHISEMTYNRQLKPADIVKVGDQVEVKIIKFDRESGKLGLSLKQSMSDPWKDVESKYPVGTKVTARVVKIESFGAFIEVEEGVQGLLPLSEMSWQRIRNPNQAVQVGQTIPLVIIAVDPAGRRMTFSSKQAAPDPWSDATTRYAKHSVHDGKILRIAEFGAFIELEPNVEGLAHISELADRRVKTVNEVVKVGDVVKVRVLDVNTEQRRMSLSLKNTEGTFVPPPEAVKRPEKKRKIPLKGGLEF